MDSSWEAIVVSREIERKPMEARQVDANVQQSGRIEPTDRRGMTTCFIK